jgi:hypothetical protein
MVFNLDGTRHILGEGTSSERGGSRDHGGDPHRDGNQELTPVLIDDR